MRRCLCGCGRVLRALNPRRQYHAECLRAKRNAARGVEYLGAREVARIEAKYQAARLARRAA